MAYQVHPVFVKHNGEDYEVLFMTEDDAFAFAQQIDQPVSITASVRLNETVEEGVTALKQMIRN